MNDRKAPAGGGRAERGEPASEPRRPYEPPAIEQSSDFETLALSCGQVGGLDCYYGGGYKTS